MHERVRKDPTRPVRRVYETTAGGIPNDEHIPEYHNIRSRVQRYRSTFMPPIPSDVKDVVIDGAKHGVGKTAGVLLCLVQNEC